MKRILLLVTALISILSFGQQDLYVNYKSFECVGEMPDDFSKDYELKIEEILDENPQRYKGKKGKQFLTVNTKSIDQLLKSGLITYGDPITLFVNKVADKLLENDPELRKKLRFYTLKSNVTNALSTDQGIIFVTTGLISEISNEAQLAAILTHEIVHFKEDHVLNAFKYQKTGSAKDYKSLINFSKDHEFEADLKGMEIYRKAGYKPEELISVFDVLMYSYLPFDEIPMTTDYIGVGKIKIPENRYGQKDFPITAVEDYKDELSTHPNIKKRKEAIEAEIEKKDEWGNEINYLDEKEFNDIRSIARMESVRLSILDKEFSEALYSIFILEKEYPKNQYLAEMKALSWLSFAQYSSKGSKSSVLPSKSDMEGEIAKFQFFLKEAGKPEINSIAFRNIYELNKLHPTNSFIGLCHDRIQTTMNAISGFSISNYSSKTFEQMFQENKKYTDSIALVSKETKTDKGSKYDRIKSKKDANNPMNFDSTNYYVYNYGDILSDEEYISKFKKNHADSANFEIKNGVMVSVSYEIDKRISDSKLETNYKNVLDGIKEGSNKCGADLNLAESCSSDPITTTSKFNDQNHLNWLAYQINENKEISLIPVDFYDIEKVGEQYGTELIGFGNVSHSTTNGPKASNIILYTIGIFTIPYLAIYIPVRLMKKNETEMSLYFYNYKTGQKRVVYGSMNQKPRKWAIANCLYSLVQKTKDEDKTEKELTKVESNDNTSDEK